MALSAAACLLIAEDDKGKGTADAPVDSGGDLPVKPVGTEKSGTPSWAPPAARATDFAKAGTKHTAESSEVSGAVEGGVLTVSAGTAKLTFEYTSISWGKTAKALGKPETSSSGKIASTARGEGIMEKVSVKTSGFENDLEIASSGGEGDLKLSGRIDTALRLEETFECEEGATTFSTTGDLVFLDSTDSRVLKVGRVFVRDSKGVEMIATLNGEKTKGGIEFDLVIAESWLAKATFPITVDPLIGSPASATAGNGVEDFPGGLAFGSTKYLMTYMRKVNISAWDIYAQFINADGTLSGSAFLVISSVGSWCIPDVAYVSGSSGVYGIVYGNSSWNVWLKRFNTSGTLLSTTQLNSTSSSGNATAPVIASDGASQFCMAWRGAAISPSIQQIWGEIRNSAGTLVKDDTLLAAASGVYDLDAPDLSWNATSSHWFVSFDYFDGSVGGSLHTLKATSWNSGLTVNSVPVFTIATSGSVSNSYSANAWNSIDNEYLVVWNQSAGVSSAVRGRRVRASDGVLLGSEFAVESDTRNSIWGDVAYSAASNRYLVTFDLVNTSSVGGVYGQVVLNSGSLWQGMFTINDDSNTTETYTYLGKNAGADEFLCNWRDLPSGGSTYDIWYVRMEITPPPVPTGLAGTGGDTIVNLTWTAVSAPDLAGYNVYKQVTVGMVTSWVKQNSTPIVPTAYTATGLTNGTDYHFCITSIDTHDNESAKTAEIIVRPKDATIPATPSGLTAVAGYSKVTLSWTANSEPDLAGYNLYRSTAAGGPFTKINGSLIAPVASPTYNDTTVTNKTTYWYKVTAQDISTNESAQSSSVSATPTYPIPTALTFDSSTYNSITFHWSPPTFPPFSVLPPLAGYNVYRSAVSGGPYAGPINGTLITGTSYTDSGLSSGTYFYVVTAKSTLGDESLYSGELAASTTAVPPPTLDPSNNRKTNDTTPAITGTSTAGWTITLYEAGIANNSGTVDGTGHFSVNMTELAAGPHTIYARATVPIAGSPTSGYSVDVIVTIDVTAPAAPTGVTVVSGLSSDGATGWVEVQWAPNEELDLLGYNVYRRDPAIGTWTKQNDKPLLKTKYLQTGLTIGQHYDYKVRATDDALNEGP